MMQKALFPGQYLQGAGALNELPALVTKYGSKALLSMHAKQIITIAFFIVLCLLVFVIYYPVKMLSIS